MKTAGARSIVLVGYSGHGHVVARAALDSGHRLIGYCDAERKDLNPYGLDYLGEEEDYDWEDHPEAHFFVAIGRNDLREHLFRTLLLDAPCAPALQQRSAYVAEGVRLEEGVLVAAGATIQVGAAVGRGAIVNTGASVDHDVVIGAFAHVAPNATLTGGVRVGSGALVGANATVLPGLQIGAGATLGAGAVLTRYLPPGQTWVGNPARPLEATDT